MKERVLSRFLKLKKETVAHLNIHEMDSLRAGCGTVTISECRFDPEFSFRVTKSSQNTCYTEDAPVV